MSTSIQTVNLRNGKKYTANRYMPVNQEYTGYASRYYRSANREEAGHKNYMSRHASQKNARRASHKKQLHFIRKFTAVMIGALIIFLAGLFIGNTRAGAASQPVYTYYTTITVEKGDTIWNLADQYMQGSDLSKKEYVEKICELNQIPDGRIQPQDSITMIYYSTERK